MLALAGCGGDSGGSGEDRVVEGPGYSFAAPAAWTVERDERAVTAQGAAGAVSVTTFLLAQPYRAERWEAVVPELDGVAGRLADELGASVASASTVVVASRRARLYRLEGARDGTRRVAFLLRGRDEYQLLCRWQDERAAPGEAACARLLESFTLP